MLSEIFYLRCAECGGPCEGDMPVCAQCLERIEPHEHFCESCGYPSPIPLKLCGMCSRKGAADRISIGYRYRGPVKSLLRDIKFNYRISGRHAVGRLIHTDKFKGYDIVTDVPSHYTRRLRRFRHPAEDMARHIALETGTQYKKLLKRIRRTEYQFRLRKNQRATNVKGAFMCQFDVRGLKILLVDDIITTGSTVKECSGILKKAGASVVDVFALSGGNTNR